VVCLSSLVQVTSDTCISVEIVKDEKTTSASRATVQSALLYTTSWGERRIRVFTAVVPTSGHPAALLGAVRVIPLVAGLAKRAILDLETKSFTAVRAGLKKSVFALLSLVRKYASANPNDRRMHEALSTLPIMTLALLKCRVLRAGTDVRVDVRAYLQNLVLTLDPTELEVFLRPRCMCVFPLAEGVGLPIDGKDASQVRLPQEEGLNAAVLSSNAACLLDTGLELVLWVGRQCYAWLDSVIDRDSKAVFEHLLEEDADPASEAVRFARVVAFLRKLSPFHQQIVVVREDEAREGLLTQLLLEDKQGSLPGFQEFSQEVQSHTGFY